VFARKAPPKKYATKWYQRIVVSLSGLSPPSRDHPLSLGET
jgi:hypothetical protein